MATKAKKPRTHEGIVRVCCHRVSFYYNLPPRVRIKQEFLDDLTEHAETRSRQMIIDDYSQGELNYSYSGIQTTGWWRIDN